MTRPPAPGRLQAARSRLFAAGYDRMAGQAERAGLSEYRRALLTRASGATLEIGAGTGLNLPHYPQAVTGLTLTEPDQHMVRRLRQRALADTRVKDIVVAPGEALPVPDAAFDTVVVTLVLCTAPDPARVLAEIARVLKPEGCLLFMEHVRSDLPKRAVWQDRFQPLWRATLGNGCNCNRPTLETIQASPLTLVHVEHGELPLAIPIIRPLVSGCARAELVGSAARDVYAPSV
jgi:SAM-dependent methyltransferase